MPTYRPAPVARSDIALIDFLRTLAALLVMFGHTRGLYFLGIGDVEAPSLFVKAFYLVSSLQHEGVIIFFVISGFLVGGPAWQRIADNSFSFLTYFINRFSRIYIVYLPSIILVLLLVWAGAELFGQYRFQSERPLEPSGVNDGWQNSQLLCHLFSVEGVLCRTWGQNPPLWSLGYEWVLYFFAPILFLIADFFHRIVKVAPRWMWAIVGYYILRFHIFPSYFMDCWFAGVVAYYLAKHWPLPSWVGACGAIIALLALPLSGLNRFHIQWTDYTIALGLVLLFSSTLVKRTSHFSGFWKWSASFSFSLYVLHLPLGVFLGGFLASLGLSDQRELPALQTYAAFGFTIAVCLAVAFSFSLITEAHTGKVRSRLFALFGRQKS